MPQHATKTSFRPDTCPTVSFWKKVDRSGGAGACWPWVASTRNGYGAFGSSSTPAHRLALAFAVGPPDYPNMFALHRCRDRSCCNPKHLEWGTQKKNAGEDRLRDGTLPRGTKHAQCKLSEKDVLDIVHRYESGELAKDISADHGVVASHVGNIVSGRSWGWLTGKEKP